MKKNIKINNQIRAPKVRVIDENGDNLGVLDIGEALLKAKEKQTDLIEISPNAEPPVCKLIDYGKFAYIETRKKKKLKPVHQTSVRQIRINLGTSQHDLEVKAKKISEFLEQNDKVKIDMLLKGREKFLDKSFLEERFKRILSFISADYKISENVKIQQNRISTLLEKNKIS